MALDANTGVQGFNSPSGHGPHLNQFFISFLNKAGCDTCINQHTSLNIHQSTLIVFPIYLIAAYETHLLSIAHLTHQYYVPSLQNPFPSSPLVPLVGCPSVFLSPSLSPHSHVPYQVPLHAPRLLQHYIPTPSSSPSLSLMPCATCCLPLFLPHLPCSSPISLPPTVFLNSLPPG